MYPNPLLLYHVGAVEHLTQAKDHLAGWTLEAEVGEGLPQFTIDTECMTVDHDQVWAEPDQHRVDELRA
ncbi:hypothetical protein CI784_00330 [Arthrobacter agilis]|nr:hypothetical protein B8W74_00430 [Arthrobacter agilis]PPB47768.1 hypothetical protein CI784_00330 [Arthrobacter agilis]